MDLWAAVKVRGYRESVRRWVHFRAVRVSERLHVLHKILQLYLVSESHYDSGQSWYTKQTQVETRILNATENRMARANTSNIEKVIKMTD